MDIAPTREQSEALPTETVPLLYDDSPWTPAEMAALAGAAFAKLDDTDDNFTNPQVGSDPGEFVPDH
jgi:hypothetical protein